MVEKRARVLSLQPKADVPLSVDIKDILASLRPFLNRWVWSVRSLDWLSQPMDDLPEQVAAAGVSGLWLPSAELCRHAETVYQTLEGKFLAFPSTLSPDTICADELDLQRFPASRAELAIEAIDGGIIDVYAKDRELVSILQRFSDVREEDARLYFAQ